MFSERIMDEAALLMDKETFFKKHGKSKSGIEYGGSIKDRSWSGRGKYTGTEKFIDVRQKLADKINKYYEKIISLIRFLPTLWKIKIKNYLQREH